MVVRAIDCADAVARLQDYFKRELTPELAQEVERHLQHCGGCFAHARFEENFLLMLETRARRDSCPSALRMRIVHTLRLDPERD